MGSNVGVTAAGISLSTSALGFVYPDGTRALANVSLQIEPGTRVAIVGQNGSGKSTLVRHFNGLLRATEGSVLVAGREVGRRHVADLARLVGISFQNPDRQIFAGSVRAEVEFGPRNVGLRGDELHRRAAEALDWVGLSGRGETNPYDLGFSERKLLALASVVAMGTPAIILDEPTTGQDADGVGRIRDIIAALGARGTTVVAVSHDMAFVAENAERVIVMGNGRVLLDGSVAEVFAAASWELLRSTNLQPPYAAVVGERIGLGSTPADRDVVRALRGR